MKTCYFIPEPDRPNFAAAIADLVKFPKQSVKRDVYVITRINVRDNMRGQGYGTKILDMILEDADKENVVLLLEPSPSGGLEEKELIEWYERHGFNYGTWHMKRTPKTVKPSKENT